EKNIPIEAGLGGGSSDAAAVLRGLNNLWNLNLPEKSLLKLASLLGSDVPFFIKGGACAVSGKGEELRTIDCPKLNFIVIYPGFTINTGDAYALLDEKSWEKTQATKKVLGSWGIGGFSNDFEQVILAKFPELLQIKNGLLAAGAENALLTGSGSSMFGVFSTVRQRDSAFETLKGKYKQMFKAESIR
ncbi:4-(cytidine 5'-diphospho)-2-C-methyl-D-erythritol kinase, partial [Candidatus Woesearchaeota archaeon]|nr:4-(cytidine 5'-diphospho)-2-C-methyl-D-erythritol kinase [Candidatus Woesearchaeota archaeon]